MLVFFSHEHLVQEIQKTAIHVWIGWKIKIWFEPSNHKPIFPNKKIKNIFDMLGGKKWMEENKNKSLSKKIIWSNHW